MGTREAVYALFNNVSMLEDARRFRRLAEGQTAPGPSEFEWAAARATDAGRKPLGH